MTKLFKPVAVVAVIAMLGACSATTSGITNAVKSQAKSSAASAVVNKVAPKAKTTNMVAAAPNPTGDASLTCDQLKMEIGSVDTVLAQANTDSQESRAGNVANQATDTAIRHGVARSSAAQGVIARVPFGMSMFNKALNSRAKAAENKRIEAQNTAQNAAVRRSSLAGIYAGKGCS